MWCSSALVYLGHQWPSPGGTGLADVSVSQLSCLEIQIPSHLQLKQLNAVQRSSAGASAHSFCCGFFADGYSYEKEAMESWISTNRRSSPMTNLPLPSLLLTPNRTLKMAIGRWLETQHKHDWRCVAKGNSPVRNNWKEKIVFLMWLSLKCLLERKRPPVEVPRKLLKSF